MTARIALTLLACLLPALCRADTPPFAYTTGATLSVIWDDASKSDLVEMSTRGGGSATQAGNYNATNAELAADSVTAGIRYGRIYAGVNAAAVTPADLHVGNISGMRWNGTVTVDAEGDILTDTAEIGVAGAGLTSINLPNQTMDITGTLSGSVGSVTGAVGSVTGGVTVTTNNDKTGYALTTAPPTAAQIIAALFNEPTADSGATTVGRALHNLRQFFGSSTTGVATVAGLANAPAGGGGALTDVDQDSVPQARVFVLVQSDDEGLIQDTAKSIAIGSNPTYAVDFKNDLPAGGGIGTVSPPEIVTGTAGGVTFSVTGRNYSQARFRITGVTAGTYKCRVPVTYKTGEVAAGTFTIRVAP